MYIGSSNNLSSRFSDHTKGIRSNILLQNAINKYNLQDFIFIVFEYCDVEKLVSREQFYLDCLKPEYNILTVAGSSLGYKHTEESLAKMSGANHHFFGQTHKPEAKALMSEAKAGQNIQRMVEQVIRIQ